jgi:hypothetical protein
MSFTRVELGSIHEAHNADDNQIRGDKIIEELRDNQNQDTYQDGKYRFYGDIGKIHGWGLLGW